LDWSLRSSFAWTGLLNKWKLKCVWLGRLNVFFLGFVDLGIGLGVSINDRVDVVVDLRVNHTLFKPHYYFLYLIDNYWYLDLN
jgi:hypothetical protein